ncbi:MAG: cytochrome P450 [Pseudomonadota bacterium]
MLTETPDRYQPPAPQPLSPLRSLLRVMRQGDGDLLSLVPRDAYTKPVTRLGYSRRSILLINDPSLARDVLTDPLDIFPKNDLMVGALTPLVGESVFVSNGVQWRRQRQMIDPAFSHMRIGRAFAAMRGAVDDYIERLDADVAAQRDVSLDLAMSELTADIICRTIFSQSLQGQTARDVFEAFGEFEDSVANVNLWQLILGKPWADVKQPANVLAACARIRSHIGSLLDARLARGADAEDDIVTSIVAARDAETGEPFTREELIDQIGVFFLAGHETTASVLTWVFFILGEREDIATMVRDEVAGVVGDGDIRFEHVKQLPVIRSIFREALRLYPPITFIPRVAAEKTRIGDETVKRGAMLMISPWTAHRNTLLWRDADRFDPLRFHGAGDSEDSGVFMSFGLGPRVCVGAAFATIESTLIIAALARRYNFSVREPERVRPVARLTTRPAEEIRVQLTRRGDV